MFIDPTAALDAALAALPKLTEYGILDPADPNFAATRARLSRNVHLFDVALDFLRQGAPGVTRWPNGTLASTAVSRALTEMTGYRALDGAVIAAAWSMGWRIDRAPGRQWAILKPRLPRPREMDADANDGRQRAA